MNLEELKSRLDEGEVRLEGRDEAELLGMIAGKPDVRGVYRANGPSVDGIYVVKTKHFRSMFHREQPVAVRAQRADDGRMRLVIKNPVSGGTSECSFEEVECFRNADWAGPIPE